MYLVDTNVLSEARRGRAEARDWLRSVDPDHVYLSVVTLGEIMKGISQKARSDPGHRRPAASLVGTAAGGPRAPNSVRHR
jgi:predicted nucleic acid-binding protein